MNLLIVDVFATKGVLLNGRNYSLNQQMIFPYEPDIGRIGHILLKYLLLTSEGMIGSVSRR